MKKKTTKQIIKANLLILGDKIVEDASKNSRVAKDRYRKRDDKWGKKGELIKAGGTLRDSVNKRVIGSETLVVFHRYYGAYQKPNELLESVNRFTKEQTKVIIKEINEMIINKTKK